MMYSADDIFSILKENYLNRFHIDMIETGIRIYETNCIRAAEKANEWFDKWKEFYLANKRDEEKADTMLREWKANQ